MQGWKSFSARNYLRYIYPFHFLKKDMALISLQFSASFYSLRIDFVQHPQFIFEPYALS
jgi:hypothetical protein